MKPQKPSGGDLTRPPFQKKMPATPTANRCLRCGKSPPHGRQQCPARDATCRKCSKKGHFQAVCKSSRSVGAVQADPSDVFLGTVDADVSTVSSPWNVTLLVNGTQMGLKIDTGADVMVTPESTLKGLKGVVLQQSSRSLRGPSQCPLHVCGQFQGTLQHGSFQAEEAIFVVRGLKQPLMGRPAIEALGLVSTVDTVVGKEEEIIATYPDLFQGLGTLEGAYCIELKEDFKPFALSTPRRLEGAYCIELKEDSKPFALSTPWRLEGAYCIELKEDSKPFALSTPRRLEGAYCIELKEDSKPFALSTPRRVALPLLPRVRAELERMERMGVISRVEEPTNWCTGLVVVPKANGKVRICVDLTKLNETSAGSVTSFPQWSKR